MSKLLGFLCPAAAAAAGLSGTRAEPPQPDAVADAQARGQVYISDLPADLEPARRLLERYSGIRARDIDGHIQAIVCPALIIASTMVFFSLCFPHSFACGPIVAMSLKCNTNRLTEHRQREKLWEIYPYVCVGHFRFLSLQFTSDPQYRQALGRLLVPRNADRSEGGDGVARLLDVGCCVGQALRQLAHDGVDPHRLYGVDVEPRFADLGYELFRDGHRFAATFVVGDLLKEDCESGGGRGGAAQGLAALRGRMNIIYATSFFHLFSWAAQVRAATRMVGFLRPDDPDAMIFGRQVGRSVPPPSPPPLADRQKESAGLGQRFLHDARTWQVLWDEVGTLTGTRWRAQFEFLDREDIAMGGAEGAVRRARFGVYRA